MSVNTQRFSMRWSRLTWVVTVGASIVVALAPIVILRAAIRVGPGDGALRVLLISAAFLPLAIFGILALFAPVAFEVNPDAVVVKRLGRDLVIPRRGIREIRRVEAGQIGFAWRLAGCGGFLGWFGLFYSRSLGEFWAYTGNREDLVLLTQTDGGKIVISPHPPDTFLKAVQETDGSRRVR